jgi:hypothetical protein
MTESDIADDIFRSRLGAVIESLRYWAPSVSDAARIEEIEAPGSWRFAVTPRTPGACPFELGLRSDRRFDLMIAGDTFEDMELMPLEDFLPLVAAVAAGRVLVRRRISAATGATADVTTIVTYSNGRSMTLRRASTLAGRIPEVALEVRDRHFLPYRR